MKLRKKIIIMGAAGRDFHNFNTVFKNNPCYKVVAFTATQIPNIENRTFPASLAGWLYPRGIKIYSESELFDLIDKFGVDEVFFSYSDVSLQYLMERASEIIAAGAEFRLLPPAKTMLKSRAKVIAVTAVRTGCGKSPVTRKIARLLKEEGKRLAVIRHPMPYGDLSRQAVQRFERYEDLDKHKCTIEEREEYEPLIREGLLVYAGVDYEKILRAAEREADIIVWDGGNNDTPFVKPDVHIVICDPHRPGDELNYWPGVLNLRMAQVAVINKENTAEIKNIETVRKNILKVNPGALIIDAAMIISVDKPEILAGKSVVLVEDGPTVTHGNMAFGAAYVVAVKMKDAFKIKGVVEPQSYARGTIKEAFLKYAHLQKSKVVPALGYSPQQIKDLEETLIAIPADIVLSGTPSDLSRLIKINKPIVQIKYEIAEIGGHDLRDVFKLANFI